MARRDAPPAGLAADLPLMEAKERRIARLLDAVEALEEKKRAHHAAIEARYAPLLGGKQREILALAAELYGLAEAHRDELTWYGRKKTFDIGRAGSGRWYTTPSSVRVSDEEAAIGFLKTRPRLREFLRVKYELNKKAILGDPAVARKIPGITLGTSDKFALVLKGSSARLECFLDEGVWNIVWPREESR